MTADRHHDERQRHQRIGSAKLDLLQHPHPGNGRHAIEDKRTAQYRHRREGEQAARALKRRSRQFEQYLPD
ncbi:hypothetical protein D3C86_1789030 [compost metagenome]